MDTNERCRSHLWAGSHFVCLPSCVSHNDSRIPYLFGPGVVDTLVSPVADYDPFTMIQRLLLLDILFLAD
jgi:hypothetical protein